MLDYRPLLTEVLEYLAAFRSYNPATMPDRRGNPYSIVKTVEHRMLVLALQHEGWSNSADFVPVQRVYSDVQWLLEHREGKQYDRYWGTRAIASSKRWMKLRSAAKEAIEAVKHLPPPEPFPPDATDLPVMKMPTLPPDDYPNDENYKEACFEAGKRWWDLREDVLYVSSLHGRTGPDDDMTDPDFYLGDSWAPVRNQGLAVYNSARVTAELLLDLAAVCASYPDCGVELLTLKRGAALVMSDRLIVAGSPFRSCKGLESAVAAIRRLL